MSMLSMLPGPRSCVLETKSSSKSIQICIGTDGGSRGELLSDPELDIARRGMSLFQSRPDKIIFESVGVSN